MPSPPWSAAERLPSSIKPQGLGTAPRSSVLPAGFHFWQAVPKAPHAEPAPQDFHRQHDHGEPTLGLPASCRRTCYRGTLTGSAATGAPGQRRHGWRSRSTATAQAGIPAHDSGRVSKIKGFHFVAPRLHLPLRRTVERRCSGVVLRHGWQRGRRRWRAIPKGRQGGRLAPIPGAIGAWVRLEAPQRPARRRQLAGSSRGG